MKIHAQTKRFLLREILASDAQDMFELDSDPEVHKYLGNKPVKTIQEVEQTIQLIRAQYEENGIGRWAIIDKLTNEFIGWSGLKLEQQLRKEFHYYDIGYRLKRKYWGQGIATETAIASLKYGFEPLELEEICAAADTDNKASNHILSKIGLAFSGTFDYEGETVNWYTLKKTDWLRIEER
jgi:ribosomal-protein-alanine N-acetyltransferase